MANVRTLKRQLDGDSRFADVPYTLEHLGGNIEGIRVSGPWDENVPYLLVTEGETPGADTWLVGVYAYWEDEGTVVEMDRISTLEMVRKYDWREAYLMQHGNLRVPCSPYGWDTSSCVPIALAVSTILAAETGEPETIDSVDHVMGLVVNGHDDVAYVIREYGPLHNFDPDDYLEEE